MEILSQLAAEIDRAETVAFFATSRKAKSNARKYAKQCMSALLELSPTIECDLTDDELLAELFA